MIPFIDLKAQFTRLESDIRARMDAVLAHGKYIMGPEVKELEEQLAEFAGVKHCLSCSSGTDALLMALMALDVGPGDVVLTTPFTFIATGEVIALLGAVPVFVDIEPGTFNLDPAKLEQAIAACESGNESVHPLPEKLRGKPMRPKGVISVDLFGLPCDYGRLEKIAAKHGLFLVEDAAQGFGGQWKGKKAGSFGVIGCTSFFPAKPLGCYGDGGAVFTDSGDLAEAMASIRVHGKGSDKYDNVRVGINGRLDTLQAAVLLAKLAVFPDELEAREAAAKRYDELLAPLAPRLVTPQRVEGAVSAWAQYSVLAHSAKVKEACQAKLKEDAIPTAVYYPKPLHLQTAFLHYGYKPGQMPVSEDASGRIFSLPMHPYLEAETIKAVADSLASAIK